jgi:hypothetical protein
MVTRRRAIRGRRPHQDEQEQRDERLEQRIDAELARATRLVAARQRPPRWQLRYLGRAVEPRRRQDAGEEQAHEPCADRAADEHVAPTSGSRMPPPMRRVTRRSWTASGAARNSKATYVAQNSPPMTSAAGEADEQIPLVRVGDMVLVETHATERTMVTAVTSRHAPR